MTADWTTAVRSRDRSSRQKCGMAGCRVGELLHRRAVEVFEPLAGEHGADGHARGARPPRRQQGRRETCDQRAAIVRHHTPIMTSDALMTAQASSPVLRLRSATASFVIAEVMTIPLPISIRTWDVVAPFLTSTILPLS